MTQPNTYPPGWKKRRDIWAYISKHPSASRREIVEALRLSGSRIVQYHVDALVAAGYIKKASKRSRTFVVVVPLLDSRI